MPIPPPESTPQTTLPHFSTLSSPELTSSPNPFVSPSNNRPSIYNRPVDEDLPNYIPLPPLMPPAPAAIRRQREVTRNGRFSKQTVHLYCLMQRYVDRIKHYPDPYTPAILEEDDIGNLESMNAHEQALIRRISRVHSRILEKDGDEVNNFGEPLRLKLRDFGDLNDIMEDVDYLLIGMRGVLDARIRARSPLIHWHKLNHTIYEENKKRMLERMKSYVDTVEKLKETYKDDTTNEKEEDKESMAKLEALQCAEYKRYHLDD